MPERVDQLAEKKALGDSEQALEQCTALEADLAELKALYEQFFLGYERHPPARKHEAIKKRVLALKGLFVRQTALKFRIQGLAAKLTTYERLWERTLREVEAGTYTRDVFKAKLHKKRATEKREHTSEDLDLSDLDDDDELDLDKALAEASDPQPPAGLPELPPLKAPTKPPSGEVAQLRPLTAERPQLKPPTAELPQLKPPTGAVPVIKPVTGSRPIQPAASPASAPKLIIDAATPTPAVLAAPPKQPALSPARPATSAGLPALKPPTPSGVPTADPGPAYPGAKPAGPGYPGGAARPAVTGSNAALKGAAPPSKPPAPVGTQDGLSDQKIKAIYDAYVMAKKRCGEDTRALTLDSVASSLKKQVPELMKQHNARSVEFKVVIKDGKAVLRALPKDS